MSSAVNHGRHGRPWQRIRRQVLQRDPYCTIRGPRCTGVSTTVDHVVPLSVAPHRAHDLTNLRGACGPCNFAGGARLTNAKRRHGAPRNGAHRAHKAAAPTTATTATSAAYPCAYHPRCRHVHSRAW